MYVYVINKNGKPLMPCKSAKAKHLLKVGKAKVIIRLNARTTTLIERRMVHSSVGQAHAVSCA